MRAAIITAVFVAGFISGQITQAQPKDASALPAERVTGIGGIFMKAKDPKALGQWYSDKLGVPRPDGPVPPLFLWREREDSNLIGVTVWGLFPASTKYLPTQRVVLHDQLSPSQPRSYAGAAASAGRERGHQGRGRFQRPLRVGDGSGGQQDRAVGAESRF